jgi:hypothetical protein
MNLSARRFFALTGIGLMVAVACLSTRATVEGQGKTDPDPAVERAREQVKMLDEIYKTAVVAITDKYVNKETDTPAATIAKGLFAQMKKSGWHEAKLIDATGHPYDEKNVATTDFDKAAVAALVGGKTYFEQIAKVDGKPRLRAATPVPVVMKKCTMCHEHYNDVKANAPIGVLIYDVPVK